MTKDKSMCSGCHDDFYNQNRDEGCWMFQAAKVVERMSVGTWQNPPYVWTPRKVLSCFHCPGQKMIRKDDTRVVKNDAEAKAWNERGASLNS